MTRSARNRRIRQLARRRPKPSLRKIAEEVGCSLGTVHRVLNPDANARYRAQDRLWRQQQMKANAQKESA